MPGVWLHPQPCVRMEEAHKLKSLQAKPKHRHSLRDGVNGLCRARPGETGFCVTVALRIICTSLAPATRAPGRHAFVVRSRTARLTMQSRPSHPASYVRDDREAPLLWKQDG